MSMEPGDYFKEVKFTGGHEQTMIAVKNGDIDGSVTWAGGLGNWEDGFNSGALRKAVGAVLIDMNNLVEIWRSKPIPQGPITLHKSLPSNVKVQMTALVASLPAMGPDFAYSIMAGEAKGLMPIGHAAYGVVVEARKRKSK